MGGGLFSLAGIVETVAKEECIEALFGADKIVCGIGSGTADVTNGFI